MPIVKYEVIDMVLVHLFCFLYKAVAGFIQIFIHESCPFRICKDNLIQGLQLLPCVG